MKAFLGHSVCGHPGQDKPSALEKVERIEKLERIGVSLHTQAAKVLEMDKNEVGKWKDVINVSSLLCRHSLGSSRSL